jgi:uncharacterized membrane protein
MVTVGRSLEEDAPHPVANAAATTIAVLTTVLICARLSQLIRFAKTPARPV